MTTTARSDIHRPSAAEFDPQRYTLVFVRDFKPSDGLGDGTPFALREWERKQIEALQAQGYRFAEHVGQAHQCGHCGTALRYAALLKRGDAHELIHVGETCLDGRFELTKPEFDRLRKQSQLDREKQRLLTGFNTLCAEHPALTWATYAENIEIGIERDLAYLNGRKVFGRDARFLGTTPDDHRLASGTSYATNTLLDLARKGRQYGNLSTKQIEFAERLLGEIEGKVNDYRAKMDAPKPETGPAPTGRVQVEGLVIKEDWREGYMGGEVLKLSIKLDNGSIVWGSAPSNLLSAPRPSYLIETPYSEGEESLRGKRIRFTATFKSKPDDPSFAFYTRPVKAEVIASE